MKKNDIFDAFEKLDPKFVEEAAPNIDKKARKPLAFRLVAIAACIALLTTGVVIGTLLLSREEDEQQPDMTDEIPERIKQYQDSEYFEVIRSLDEYFEYMETLDIVHEYNGSSASNVQITDNQTHGIEEEDFIKRTNTHIFYSDGDYIRAFSIDGAESVEVGSYHVKPVSAGNVYDIDILLSEDGKTITAICNSRYEGIANAEVYSLDVSDPTQITQRAMIRLKGVPISARLKDGKLMLFVRYTPVDDRIDYGNPESFLPLIDLGNGYELLQDCEIVCNEKMTDHAYTIALMLDQKDLTLEKNIAALSYRVEPYVSKDKIFFWGDERVSENANRRTAILAVDYSGENFEVLGSVSVDGWMNLRGMDEHEGILRVVTTTQTSADLYCISLETFDEVASVKSFAPEGEIVYSVRFDGNNAYVCTALKRMNQFLDPVFFFDLSDLDNISYKETGTIEGLSTSLVDFGNGYLVGIGCYEGDWMSTLKIEGYKESEDRVVSTCKYEIFEGVFPITHEAYYIDRENQLIGFARWENYDIKTGNADYLYTLVKFDSENERFVELFSVELGGRNEEIKRGVYIDGYMYMFGENDFRVVAVDIDNIDAEQPDTDEQN